jgi:hypothetical protein
LGAAATAGFGFAATTATVAAAAPAATAAAPGAPVEAGFKVGIFPPGRAPAIPGKVGFTVIRAVSFGGWLFTTDVPVFLLDSGGAGEGMVAAGFNGAALALDGST